MNKQYLTVSALTKYIKRKLETDPHLKIIWLKGEISNFNHHSRGHMYMTIKDDQSRIQAVMFAGNNRKLKFIPENGMNVLIRGEVGVFEPYGQYQLYIQQMEPDGLGSLHLAFEQLKEKLATKGYFDLIHKKKLPAFPKHIGIITSATGAAVRDIITTIKRRYPIAHLTIIPAQVQGDLAPQSLINAIDIANEKAIFDVLIIGRGGGSIEELWSFNDENVAMAIFHSKIPVITAIGHETDQTISDFVSDVRAPTPTGAAEVAVPSQFELLDKISSIRRSLNNMMQLKIGNSQDHFNRLKQSYAFRYPDNLIKQKEQELDKYAERVENGLFQLLDTNKEKFIHIQKRFVSQDPQEKIKQSYAQLSDVTKQMNQWMGQVTNNKKRELSLMIEKLTLLNPLEIMKRGFAIPYTASGKIISSSDQVQKNDLMKVQLSDGEIDCQVLNVKENHNV